MLKIKPDSVPVGKRKKWEQSYKIVFYFSSLWVLLSQYL